MKRSLLALTVFALMVATFTSSATAKVRNTAPPIVIADFNFGYQCLNLKSISSLAPAYIELPEGYNVSDIAVSSILLNGSIPLDPSVQPTVRDSDNDTIPDLYIAFNRTKIVEYIQSEGITQGDIVLGIEGTFKRTPATFEDSDNLTVSSLVGNVNCDGIVDILDMVAAADSFETADGDDDWNHNANFAHRWDLNNIFDIVTLISHYGETEP